MRDGVVASNALTTRWLAAMATRPANVVVSGAAVWPLLAVLASGADGRVREGLEGALGLPSEGALDEALRILDWLRQDGDTNAALGIWVRDDVRLKRRWRARLPRGVLGRLAGDPGHDQAALDAWVREETLQVLDRMPVEVSKDTLMVLAQAIALRTHWSESFEDFSWKPGSGPWSDRELHGLSAGVRADQLLLHESDQGQVTTFRTDGEDRVDVYLVIGDDGMPPGVVLAESINRLPAQSPGRSWSDLQVGETAPGLLVVEEEVDGDAPAVRVRTAGFDVVSHHNLLEASEVFGLSEAAREPDLSRMSETPLVVGQAAQSARAKFTATGFEAAAVTAFYAVLGIPETVRRTIKVVDLSFDRPFGFVALDRVTRLVLFAGWVGDPEPWSPEYEELPGGHHRTRH